MSTFPKQKAGSGTVFPSVPADRAEPCRSVSETPAMRRRSRSQANEAAGRKTHAGHTGPAPGRNRVPADATRHKRYATDATYKLPRTWAQIAIIPRNKVSEARAAASSTTARNMANPLGLLAGRCASRRGRSTHQERTENIVLCLFCVKRRARDVFRDEEACRNVGFRTRGPPPASYTGSREMARIAEAGRRPRPR